MFYQYNPAEPNWENMHWGHAVSKDLIHWEEKDTALFPDERGMMFSGCAVRDEKNLVGKGKDALLLFYTTTEPFCQYISYSIDGFKSITDSKKPVVPHIAASNRDPKVVFCDELECYVMALYLEDDIYCILKSDNLTDWSELQRVRLDGDNECPDIFPLTLADGTRKWILIGSHDKYLVGNFDNEKFSPEQPLQSLSYSSISYAGQSISNMPMGRNVRIVWDMWNSPTFSFKGQMGIPQEMTLSRHDGKYYLEANPVKEIEGIFKEKKYIGEVFVKSEEGFRLKTEYAPHILKIKSKMFSDAVLSIEIFGRRIDVNLAKNEIKIGDHTAPVSITRGDVDITVVIDRCSAEVFADGGKILMACLDENTIFDRNIPYIAIKSDRDIVLDNVEIISLDSVWNV